MSGVPAIEGDPVAVRRPPGSVIDVEVLTGGSRGTAVPLRGLGTDPFDGVTIREAPALSSWLPSEQRHVAAASEATLHKAAAASMSQGDDRGGAVWGRAPLR
ncbi:MAG: hypothetical protein OEX04_16035 [Acidimicrobiia bacterium]|nr:hypothetical protein [Acidimicrobiia bacterium]MDH4308977.1 hypothetical protein [Acidimicrobiia bacterium]MDH5294624.1 hypothetical protein [Acidimicrobiia bacterium]